MNEWHEINPYVGINKRLYIFNKTEKTGMTVKFKHLDIYSRSETSRVVDGNQKGGGRGSFVSYTRSPVQSDLFYFRYRPTGIYNTSKNIKCW